MGFLDFFKSKKEDHDCCCGERCCCKHTDDFLSEYYSEELIMNMNKVRENAEAPSYAVPGDAGLDVKASSFIKYFDSDNTCYEVENMNLTEFVLHPMQRLLVGTGIKADIPEAIFFLGAIRSGISTKHGIMLVNGLGVIDNIYKGEFCLPFINMSSVAYTFNIGDRIGQILPMKQIKIIPTFMEKGISKSERGDGGFGHTGGYNR